MTRLMSVLLPDPDDPTSAVVVPAGARKDTCFSTGTPGLYSNQTSLECRSRPPLLEARAIRVVGILARRVEQFVDAVEPGEGLADLRADRRDLHDRAPPSGP